MQLRADATWKTFLLLSLPVWTLLAALSLLDNVWYYWSRDIEVPLLDAATYWTGYYLAWAIAGVLLYLIIVRGRLGRRPAPFLIGAYLVLCFGTLLVVDVAAAVFGALIWWPFAGVSPVGFAREIGQVLSAQAEQPLITRYYRSFFIFFGTVAVVHFFDYYAGAEAERKEALHSRLRALRLELNPHFLFNSLHGVMLLIDQQPAMAEKMLVRLGDYLRRVLRESDSDKVTLDRELSFVREYVDIERIRFADRLQLEIYDPAGLGRALVPAMLLQPLVENALVHGAPAAAQSSIRILISIERRGDRLLLGVHNTGGATGNRPRRRGLGGVGHGNTHARLQATYGDNYDMSTVRIIRGGYLTEIEIPYEEEA
ncbi:MAG: sensor histidine kinase [Gammaproteobacteria bacterium]